MARILDELGVPMIEAGFPTSNPKELELFERLSEAGLTRGRVRVRDDPPARRGGRRGRGAARARRVVDAGLDARRQDLGPAPREGRARGPRREPAHDRGVGRVPGRVRQARDLRRRALLRRLPRRPGYADRVPARGAGRRRRERHDVRHQRRVAAAPGGRGRPRRACRAAGRCAGHPHAQRRRVRGGQFAGGDRRGRPAGAGHDERLRRALRQREPDLDHPEPPAEDGLLVPAVAGGADRGLAHGRGDAQPARPTRTRPTWARTRSRTRAGCTSPASTPTR